MKFKNFLSAIAVAVVASFALVACGPEPIEEKTEWGKISDIAVDYESVYHYGNATATKTPTQLVPTAGGEFTVGTASLLKIDKLEKAGTHIVGIRLYVEGNVKDASVFLAKGEKGGYENPEIVKSFTHTDGGWDVVLFDKAWELGKGDIYIGYKLTTNGAFYVESASNMDEMLYFGGEWGSMKTQAGNFVACVQALVIGGDYSSVTNDDIAVVSVDCAENTRAGEKLPVSCTLINNGTNKAKNVEVSVNIGGQTYKKAVGRDIIHSEYVHVTFDDAVAPSTTGSTQCQATVTMTAQDQKTSNNSSNFNLTVFAADAPLRNAVLFEQFTGQDCPNCPNGATTVLEALNQLTDEEKEHFVWVTHHSGYYPDIFTTQGDLDIAKAFGVNAAPMCMVNRSKQTVQGKSELVWHPGYTTVKAVKNWLGVPAGATIDMTTSYDASTRTITATVSGKVYTEDDQYLTVLLTQDGLVASQAGGGQNYVHNNTVRCYLTAATGDTLEIDGNGNYTATYSYKIPETVTSVGINKPVDVPTDPGQMHIVAFTHGESKASSPSAAVTNAIKKSVTGATEPANIQIKRMMMEQKATGKGLVPRF